MSQLTGASWPASLDVGALELPAGISVRTATEDDRSTYVELTLMTLGRYAREIYRITDDAVRDGLNRDFLPDLTVILERGTQPIAVVVVEQRPDAYWLDLMVVDPAEQGSGLGMRVVRWIQEAAASDGLDVTLSVVDGNPARNLYARLGFTVDRVDPPRTYMAWRHSC